MNRLASWMLRLYPARWRARYGDEMEALLADTGADARVVTDLLQGGMRMQFRTWSFLKLAVVLSIAGALLGIGLGFLIPSEYMSKATLQIAPAQISADQIGTPMNNQLSELIQWTEIKVLSRASLSRIINDPRLALYTGELKERPLEDVIEEMKRNIQVDFVALPGALGKRASAFDIIFTYPDRFKARQTVNALIAAFSAVNVERSSQSFQGRNEGLLVVLDQPSLPVSPFYPNWLTIVLFAFGMGAAIAAIWRIIRRKGFIARHYALATVAFGIVCMIAALVARGLDVLPNRYRSMATLGLPQGASPDQIQVLKAQVFSRTSLSTVISNPRLSLYKDQVRTQPIEDVIQTMKQNLTVRPIQLRDQIFFNVSFDYYDRYKARQTLQTIVNLFFEADQRLYPSAAQPRPAISVVMDVLDSASLPTSPIKPNRYRIACFGGALGLIVAAVIALIRRRWKPEPDFPIDAVHE